MIGVVLESDGPDARFRHKSVGDRVTCLDETQTQMSQQAVALGQGQQAFDRVADDHRTDAPVAEPSSYVDEAGAVEPRLRGDIRVELGHRRDGRAYSEPQP